MQSLFNIINVPLGFVLSFFADVFSSSFAAAVFFFTLVLNLALIPLTVKSQKSTVQQTRIKPKLDELRERYKDDRQKLAEETQKLYTEEKVSMSGGCLPMLIRMLLIFSIYSLIMSPLTYLQGIDRDTVSNISSTIRTSAVELKKKDEDKYNKINEKYSVSSLSDTNQIALIRLVEDTDTIKEIVGKKKFAKIEKDLETISKGMEEKPIEYSLFGVDLTEKPKFDFDIFNSFKPIWLLPICAFLAQMLTSFISTLIQKKNNPDAPSMTGLMLTMPLMSLFIGFTFPGGVCFYWICSSLIGGLIQAALQVVYNPHKMLATERAKELAKRCDFEAQQLQKFSGTEN